MATTPTLAQRLLVAGGFAIAVSAAPLMAALAIPAGSALADCPPTAELDPVTGACKPSTFPAPAPTLDPLAPGITDVAPGGLTETAPGNVGQLPEINGIPCTGANTGLCIGLAEQNAGKPPGMPVVPGVGGG